MWSGPAHPARAGVLSTRLRGTIGEGRIAAIFNRGLQKTAAKVPDLHFSAAKREKLQKIIARHPVGNEMGRNYFFPELASILTYSDILHHNYMMCRLCPKLLCHPDPQAGMNRRPDVPAGSTGCT
jgi:hypothetical protein